jgi:mycoredoxin-dependent peroxiredoxin
MGARRGSADIGTSSAEFTAAMLVRKEVRLAPHRAPKRLYSLHLASVECLSAPPGLGTLLPRLSTSGENTMSIAVGDKAPDFTLQDQDKKEIKLSDFAGKQNVVLVWYPLDWSPTCTNEHVCFVNEMKSFETLDAAILGVSVDSIWSHKAYAEKMGIKYSLLADFHPKGAMSEKYGAYLADKGITGRAIAIVGKDGKIAWFKNYDIPVVPDVKEVAAALGKVKSAAA